MRNLTISLLLALAAGGLGASPAAALEPDRGKPDHARMLLETGVYLLGGTVWYFAGQEVNEVDWDLTVDATSLKTKFLGLSQVRFDNNTFLFNQVYHPLAHAGIHLTARANDMSPFLAFAYVFSASLLWEYIGELREKVSINDMIVSPMTGWAWGEVAYQYGEYFASPESRGRHLHRAVTGFFGIPRVFHDWLDDEKPPSFTPPRFHPEPRASLVGGARQYGDGPSEVLTTMEIASKMTVMPGWGTPGRDFQRFRDGNFSDLEASLQFSARQVEIDVDATATIAGIYGRDIKSVRDGEYGTEFMIGGGRGYRLISREGANFADRVALAHLFGPTSQARLFLPGGVRVDLGLDAFFDFTAIRTLALDQLTDSYGEQVLDEIRTDTQKHGYYFGWGFTVSPSIAVDLQRARLELATDISRVRSIQGVDRFQERVTREIILRDLVFETRAALILPLPVPWLDVRIQGHLEQRRSALDEFNVERTYRELQAGLQSRF